MPEAEAPCISRHAGPYERWTFSERLGRPFAFPAIRDGGAEHYTALMDGGADPAVLAALGARLPPRWNPDGRRRTIVPFAFPLGECRPAEAASRIAGALAGVEARAGDVDPDSSPRFRLNVPVARESWVPDYRPDAPPAIPGDMSKPPALIGIIEDGIPFAHRAFRRPDGTSRIAHCWLQAARADAVAAVPFGRELTGADIMALREVHGADEARLYRAAGAVEADLPELGTALWSRATHGAHIAGLAAGNDPALGAPPLDPSVQVVAVQLPNTVAWDTSGFGKETYMLAALDYIFHRARLIAEAHGVEGELPLVVNFSYGWSAGGHDGGSEMETAIEELLSHRREIQPRSAVVMPAGNNFAEEMHARIGPAEMASGRHALGWRIAPDDRTSSYLEIWFDADEDPTGHSVELLPPQGYALDAPARVEIAAEGRDAPRFAEIQIGGATIGQLSVDRHRSDRWRVVAALAPSAPHRDVARRAPSGLWQIEIARNGAAAMSEDARIDLWVQRDDDPAPLGTGGRQSRLVDLGRDIRPIHPLTGPSGVGLVRGFGSLNGIACGRSTTRVAGRNGVTGRPAPYSGAGALQRDAEGALHASGARPTIDAVSDQGRARPGLPSIGVLSGSTARLVGTSAAAARVTREMARNAAEGRDLDAGLEPVRALEGDDPVRAAMDAVRFGEQRLRGD